MPEMPEFPSQTGRGDHSDGNVAGQITLNNGFPSQTGRGDHSDRERAEERLEANKGFHPKREKAIIPTHARAFCRLLYSLFPSQTGKGDHSDLSLCKTS